MPYLTFDYFQPYSAETGEPSFHEWQAHDQTDVAPGYSHGYFLEEAENLSGFDIAASVAYDWCGDSLRFIDENGVLINPTPSEIEFCVSNQLFQGHQAVVIVPESADWVWVRACDETGIACSAWSNAQIVPEVDLDHGLALGILIIILLKALVERWAHGEK